jgi:hypothetical protein
MSAASISKVCRLVSVHFGVMTLVKCHRSRSIVAVSIVFALGFFFTHGLEMEERSHGLLQRLERHQEFM